MSQHRVGIIGGSGLYDMAELGDREERRVDTPFGEPSGPYVIGTLRGQRVGFLPKPLTMPADEACTSKIVP